MPSVVARPQLGSGLGATRGVKTLAPTDVAEAIVNTLRYGTIDVWVPKAVDDLNTWARLLPRRAAGGSARRQIGADRVLFDADAAQRAGYELRAAQSEPGLSPAPQTPRLDAAPARDEAHTRPSAEATSRPCRHPGRELNTLSDTLSDLLVALR